MGLRKRSGLIGFRVQELGMEVWGLWLGVSGGHGACARA